MPWRAMSALLGTHQTPPENPVDPPTLPRFSRITARLPSRFAARAAHMDPPPLPTMTKSYFDSRNDMSESGKRQPSRRRLLLFAPAIARNDLTHRAFTISRL